MYAFSYIALIFLIAHPLVILPGQGGDLKEPRDPGKLSVAIRNDAKFHHSLKTKLAEANISNWPIPIVICINKQSKNTIQIKETTFDKVQHISWKLEQKHKQTTLKQLLGIKHKNNCRNNNYQSPKRSKNGTYYRTN